MRFHRFLSFLLLGSCFLLLLAALPTKAQCGPNIIGFGDVGVVSGNPFHAEVTLTRTGHSDANAILRPNFPESVARDSQGRIRTERVAGEFKRDNGPDAGTEVEGRIIVICDPVAATLTQIDTATATAKIIHSRSSAARATGLLPAAPRSFCSSRMPSDHARAHLQVEDLGIQIIEGVEARGERITLPMLAAASGEESASGESTSDRWCSDSLSALILTVTNNSRTGRKSTIAMQNIERTEPDPALFQIPPGYTTTESVAEPKQAGRLPQ